MTFRTKLLVISSLTVAGAVALVTGAVSLATRGAFERVDAGRRSGLLQQFQREMEAQSRDVERTVKRAAATGAILKIAIEADRPAPDFAPFLEEAKTQADAQALEFVDILQQDRAVISSAAAPARFGYQSDWLTAPEDWSGGKAFLTRIPLVEGSATALASIQAVHVGDHQIYVAGAKRLDASFLSSLGLAPGMRAVLWLSTGEWIGAAGGETRQLSPLIDAVRRSERNPARTVRWTSDPASAESIVALPLEHAGNLIGALLVGTSLREQANLEQAILWIGVIVGGAGVLLGALIGWWTTARVTRPVSQLVAGVQAVAAGDWSAHVAVASRDEIGTLGQAFNTMTAQLIEQRDRTLQAERVAAWRELARRLAHELKNPLFPLQITVENLRRAREHHPDQFDEVFEESTATLLAEVQNLRKIIGQFSDFAKMPSPEIEAVDANEVIRDVVRLHEPQCQAEERPPIQLTAELTAPEARVSADPLQLRRALSNLVLNAMDAMPEGGTLRIRSERLDDRIRIEVIDSGQGLTGEECERLFTPYYTTKQHGTGLGLAIVQSVVADHGGRIAVQSQPGRGASFQIDLPVWRRSDV